MVCVHVYVCTVLCTVRDDTVYMYVMVCMMGYVSVMVCVMEFEDGV